MNKLILLRHGQSQWNLENRFTGWKDVPLTDQGKEEAKKAGQLLKKNNVKIDAVFSSVLQRANKTAEITLKQTSLEHLWKGKNLNMIKNESLNERDYGDLVGLNKKETVEKFGKEQVVNFIICFKIYYIICFFGFRLFLCIFFNSFIQRFFID